MNIIPLQPLPSQTLDVTLAGQSCLIAVYQKTTGVFLDLSSGGIARAQGVLCHDRVPLVRYPYRGFSGDLVFMDTQGADDPQYTGMGSRWLLGYLTAEEVA